MNNFIASYKIILKVLNKIYRKENFIHQIRKPKFSNLELIAEYKSKDSENYLFKESPDLITNRIERSVYDR